MKRALAIAMSLAVAFGAYAQGVFNGNTGSGGAGAKCFESNGGVPGSVALGSTATGQWYVGPAGVWDNNQLVATGPPKAFSGGYCQAGAITTPYPVGSTVTVQLRAWKGASSYEAAQTTYGALYGKSATFQVSGLVTGTALPPTVSITGFTLGPLGPPNIPDPNLPEPSTIALSVLGLSILLCRRRK